MKSGIAELEKWIASVKEEVHHALHSLLFFIDGCFL